MKSSGKIFKTIVLFTFMFLFSVLLPSFSSLLESKTDTAYADSPRGTELEAVRISGGEVKYKGKISQDKKSIAWEIVMEKSESDENRHLKLQLAIPDGSGLTHASEGYVKIYRDDLEKGTTSFDLKTGKLEVESSKYWKSDKRPESMKVTFETPITDPLSTEFGIVIDKAEILEETGVIGSMGQTKIYLKNEIQSEQSTEVIVSEKETLKPSSEDEYPGQLDEFPDGTSISGDEKQAVVESEENSGDWIIEDYGNPEEYGELSFSSATLFSPKAMSLLLKGSTSLSQATEYNLDGLGTYPAPYTQDGADVRNPDPKTVEYDEAYLTKYASQTDTAGDFGIDLKVQGKKTTSAQKIDIILVLDNSGSMGTLGSTGLARWRVANNAVGTFVNGLLNPTVNPAGNIRIGLVSYGSDLKPANSYPLTTVATSLVGTDTNNTNRNGVLPDSASGGTFTQKAIREAGNILSTSTADKKIIVLLSDGFPTYSYTANGVTQNTGANVITDYEKIKRPTYSITAAPQSKATSFTTTLKGNGSAYYISSYSAGGYSVNNNGFPTMSEAMKIKDSGAAIFSIGVELADWEDPYVDQILLKGLATNVMKNIASGADHYYDATDVNELSSLLSQISTVISKTVSSGTVTDPMGDMVDLDVGSDGVFSADDYVLTSSSPGLLTGATVSYDADSRQISINGLTLGEFEWVNLSYKVKLRIPDQDYQGDFYYQTNGRTTLNPSSSQPAILRDFSIPSVKGPRMKGSIEITKIDKSDPLNPELLGGAVFELRSYREGGAFTDPNGEKYDLVNTGTTGSDGKLLWTEVPFGSYKLVETEAPQGHNKAVEPIDVMIYDSTAAIQVEVQNTKIAKLPSTGGSGTLPFTLAGLILMGSALAIYRKKMK